MIQSSDQFLTAIREIKKIMTDKRPPHLCIRPLTIYDLNQVDLLESDGFNEDERASFDKLKYRLTVCPELCSGLFIRTFEDSINKGSENSNDSDYDNEIPPNHSTIKSEKLIGHIIATKQFDSHVTDRSMEIPKLTKDFLHDLTIKDNEKVGHVENGRVIGIHSMVISKDFRGLKLGSLLLKDYLQKMNQQYVSDKVVLIAKEKLLPFYKNIGFIDEGISNCNYANEEWHDMCFILTHEEDEEDE